MYIKPQTDPRLVLDVRGADRKPGAKVILFSDKGDYADNQLWYEDERGVLRSKMNNFAIDSSGNLIGFLCWRRFYVCVWPCLHSAHKWRHVFISCVQRTHNDETSGASQNDRKSSLLSVVTEKY